MDEIHRFTKAQQDVFLPFVEKGTITLYYLFIGFNVNLESARLQRILVLKSRVPCYRAVECLFCRR